MAFESLSRNSLRIRGIFASRDESPPKEWETEIKRKDPRQLSYDHAHRRQSHLYHPPIDNKTLTILWLPRQSPAGKRRKSCEPINADSFELPSYFHALCEIFISRQLRETFVWIPYCVRSFIHSFNNKNILCLALFWIFDSDKDVTCLLISLSVIIIYTEWFMKFYHFIGRTSWSHLGEQKTLSTNGIQFIMEELH